MSNLQDGASWKVGNAFASALRRATHGHTPVLPLLDPKFIVDTSTKERSLELTDALAEAAALPEHYGATAVLPRSALQFAVVDPAGGGREAESELEAWLSEASDDPALRELVRTASLEGARLRSIATATGKVMVVYAASAARARRWPLPPMQRRRLEASPHWVVLAAMAVTRSPCLQEELSSLFDLTPAEARAVVGVLNAPTVESAARRLHASVASTREALNRAKRKIGCRNVGEMTRRVLDALLRGPTGVTAPNELETLCAILELTPSEGRVALLVSQGSSASETSLQLNIGVETVKSHLRSAFAKVGVNRSRELGRVVLEARALNDVRRAAELVTCSSEREGRLRLLAVRHRTVAFVDYGGEPGARALFVCHGFAGGRTLPCGFAALLRSRGWRPMVPQRPGYGLTDPVATDVYFSAAADDMAAIASSLGYEVMDVLARDSAAPTLFALCEQHPGRVDRAALLNPKAPAGPSPPPKGVLAACSRFLVHNPALIATFVEMLRRQTRTELLQSVLIRACADAPSDAAAIADPAVMRHMVEDIQALVARSSAGVACEQTAYARWVPARPPGPPRWSVGWSVELGLDQMPQVWRSVLGVEPVPLPKGGYLIQFTHPGDLLQLLGGAAV